MLCRHFSHYLGLHNEISKFYTCILAHFSIKMSWILTNHCLTLHVCAAVVFWPNILCQLYWGWCPVQSPIQGHPSPSLQHSVAGVSLQEKYMLGISSLTPPYTLHNTSGHLLFYTRLFLSNQTWHASETCFRSNINKNSSIVRPRPIVLCWWEKKPTHPAHMPFFCANSYQQMGLP